MLKSKLLIWDTEGKFVKCDLLTRVKEEMLKPQLQKFYSTQIKLDSLKTNTELIHGQMSGLLVSFCSIFWLASSHLAALTLIVNMMILGKSWIGKSLRVSIIFLSSSIWVNGQCNS